MMVISEEAVNRLEGPRTMRFLGSIWGHEMVILVDSGSSHTFISEQLASKLQGVTSMKYFVSVKVANGQLLSCSLPLLQTS